MVKPSMKECSSLCPERFFKVYLPNRSSKRMKLPAAFLKNINSTLPLKSTIIDPMKSSWQVDLEKVDNNLYFHKGWEQFVQHHSLEDGDFLVFVYDNNDTFHVQIYGKNGCGKDLTYPNEKHIGGSSLPDDNQSVTKKESASLEHESENKNYEKNNKALEEASKFKSDFPFFTIVMHPSYVKRGNLNIPGPFLKTHMIVDTPGATLVYLDKSWPVRVYRSARPAGKLTCGSLAFSKDNDLNVGDVCVFELVDFKDNYFFNVNIFRCS